METKTRDIFLAACTKIAEQLATHGFKPMQKAQTIRKTTRNKKVYLDIHFQSSVKNWNGGITLWPYLSIASAELKKWQLQQHQEVDATGTIFATRLENLTPLKHKTQDWNMAVSNQENVIPKLCELIVAYALPLIDLFEDTDQAVQFMVANGVAFNEHFDTRHQNLPVDFLCCFGSTALAQQAFDNYLLQQKLTGSAKRFYEEIAAKGEVANRVVTDSTMRAAYRNQLTISS
nr:DUF4304 domain-containing protein [uncultured Chitinophaga sp.]